MRALILRLLFFTAGVLPGTLFGQTLEQSPLPIVLVDTDGWLIFDEPKIDASMIIFARTDGKENRTTDSVKTFAGPIGIELRGKTSQLLSPKKPYAVEVLDEKGNKNDLPLLGCGSEHDYILLAPYSDKTLIRDRLGFSLASRLDALAYTPHTQFVELLINGEYRGLYVWTEKIKRDVNRVRIRNADNDTSVNSFIVKLDKGAGFIPNEYWNSNIPPRNALNNQRIRFLFHYPKPENVSPSQSAYIQRWMKTFEDTLASPGFRNPATGYRAFIDVPSFIDYFLMTELARNVDGYRISSFFYKDDDRNDPLLHAGPVWDFNICFGNADYCDGYLTEGWAKDFNKVCGQDYFLVPFWWDRLLEDPAFREQTRLRWQALRAGVWSDGALEQLVTQLATEIAGDPVARNFQRWPVMGVKVWPNHFVGATWEEELDYLKQWLLKRAAWMDEALR